MEKKTSIKVPAEKVLDLILKSYGGLTVAEIKDILNNLEVVYEIESSGDYDKGDYKEELKTITITY